MEGRLIGRWRLFFLRAWNRPDPMGMVDGPNMFQYALGNPVRWIDYSGTLVDSPTATFWSLMVTLAAVTAMGTVNPGWVNDVEDALDWLFNLITAMVGTMAATEVLKITCTLHVQREMGGARSTGERMYSCTYKCTHPSFKEPRYKTGVISWGPCKGTYDLEVPKPDIDWIGGDDDCPSGNA